MSDRALRVGVEGGDLLGTITGEGSPLVALHGGPGLSDYTELLLPELAGWSVVRYTQRGCAPSTARRPYTVSAHVADAVAVLDAVGFDSAVLVGHSWGAFLACCVAASVPARVAGMVLIDGLGVVGDGGMAEFGARMNDRLGDDSRARARELETIFEQGTGGDAEATESFTLYWPCYFVDPASAPQPPAGLTVSMSCYMETFASLRSEIETGSLADGLRTYDKPVEVVYGAGSPMPGRTSLDTAELLRNAVTHAVERAGHFPWLECPGSVRAALSRLAARLN